jgi:hypothetical protein
MDYVDDTAVGSVPERWNRVRKTLGLPENGGPIYLEGVVSHGPNEEPTPAVGMTFYLSGGQICYRVEWTNRRFL